ncbi:hypothetical protein [Streptomyces sp. NPDC059788]|uniref:hypothetical protein n=1 Tax=Streptomyces sp. NPDC059788 TaxID=3346948 RepID=UPI003651269C
MLTDGKSGEEALAEKLRQAATVGDVAKVADVPFLPEVLGYQLKNCNAKVSEPLPNGRGRAVALTAAVTRGQGELLKSVAFCGVRVHKATTADTTWALFLDIDVNKGLGDIPAVKDFLSQGGADFVKVGHVQLLVTNDLLTYDSTFQVNAVFRELFPELFPAKLPALPYPGQTEEFAPGVHVIAKYRLGGREQPFLRVDITKK